MIGADFEYHLAHSIDEAIALFHQLRNEGKAPLFFNGGTEIITLMRTHQRYTGTKAMIDIKKIPDCRFSGFTEENDLVIGASVPLAEIEEMFVFPLLSKNCSRIADHTSRGKITLGGNVCGHIKYKETVLPLLLVNCDLVIADDKGVREVSIHEVFDQHILLEPGSFIVQFLIRNRYFNMPFVSKKMTKIDRIGYPLLTVSALQTENEARFAFSGLCEYPFRSLDMEHALNNQELSMEDRISSAIEKAPVPILDDMEGSAAYRKFVLRNVLEESMAELERGEHI